MCWVPVICLPFPKTRPRLHFIKNSCKVGSIIPTLQRSWVIHPMSHGWCVVELWPRPSDSSSSILFSILGMSSLAVSRDEQGEMNWEQAGFARQAISRRDPPELWAHVVCVPCLFRGYSFTWKSPRTMRRTVAQGGALKRCIGKMGCIVLLWISPPSQALPVQRGCFKPHRK